MIARAGTLTWLLVRVGGMGWDGGVSEAMQGLCVVERSSVHEKKIRMRAGRDRPTPTENFFISCYCQIILVG